MLAEQMLKEFVINKLFFSCHGICQDGGIREQRAPCAVEAADAAGVGAQVPAGGQQQVRPPLVRAHLPLPEIDTLITDRLSDDEFRQELARNNVDVIEVSPAAKGRRDNNNENPLLQPTLVERQ